MPRPVCVACNVEMHNVLTGGVVLFNAKAAPKIEIGPALREEQVGHKGDQQGPYQLWGCDVFGCSECGATVVTRYAERPLWESHEGEDKYKQVLARTPPVAIVNETGGR